MPLLGYNREVIYSQGIHTQWNSVKEIKVIFYRV